MHSTNVIRICGKKIFTSISSRYYGYKTIKRPDLSNLKMPTDQTAPKLLDILKEKIKLNGPISVADYMQIVTTNPVEGYYMKKEVIGREGDFITSPEISQLFGEIIAIWLFSESRKMSLGKPLQIVELGPGKGTLIVDILRVLNTIGYEAKDLSLHLVEISTTMRTVQANRLCVTHRSCEDDMAHYYEGETVDGTKVYWYEDLKKVPQAFSWYIAHEFFDALPIHKFEKTSEGWREMLIDVDENDKLFYRMSGKETQAVKIWVRHPLDDGVKKQLEVSPKSLSIARQLAQRVDSNGGLALIADYGHEGDKTDTFRAFHKHKVVNPLENPGTHDLTADVDFMQLKLAASKTSSDDNCALIFGPVTQRDFLIRSQAELRLQALVDNAKDEHKENFKAAYEMLTDPDKMGERFKFMAFYPSSISEILGKCPPLGFSTFDKV